MAIQPTFPSTMSAPNPISDSRWSGTPHRRIRSLTDVTDVLDGIVRRSPNLLKKPCPAFQVRNETYELPRYMFIGPQGGGETLRIGIFAGIHGDEPSTTHSMLRLVQLLERASELASGYCLFLYPICNPTGFEDNTRNSRRGRDLNREFWNNTKEPEVQLLQNELSSHAFHGIISLHADDTSEGLYGFVRGATLTQNLIEPALKAAEKILPINQNGVIDGFAAENGIIREGYQGILSAPFQTRPKPFEIILETPSRAPQYLQEQAFVLAINSILNEFRNLLAYAANL